MLSSTVLLACVCAGAVSLLPLIVARSYSNGLIFYELGTHTPYLPPTVSVSRGRNLASVKYSEKGSIWSTFGQPCECRAAICGCCAGLKVDQYKFDQKVCANITFVPHLKEAQLEVYLNERPSSKYGISLRNPSPFCIPVMMGVPMAMCVQLTDVAMVGNNLNMCMDFVVRLATTDLFEMHFQCMRMGLDGVQYVDKNGKPVLPPGDTKAEEHDTDTLEYDYAELPEDGNQQTEQPDMETQTEAEFESEPEPLPIESEMLMAGDQELAVSASDNHSDGDADVEGEGDVGVVQAQAQQEEAPQLAADSAGESDLKQNEVIETITNSITGNKVPAATTTTATTLKPAQLAEDEVEASVEQQPTISEEVKEEAGTAAAAAAAVAAMADDSDNEVNVDDEEEVEEDDTEPDAQQKPAEAAEALSEGQQAADSVNKTEAMDQTEEAQQAEETPAEADDYDDEDADDGDNDDSDDGDDGDDVDDGDDAKNDDKLALAQEASAANDNESAVRPNDSSNNNEPSREAVDGNANGTGVKQLQLQLQQ
ncbi:uncharacterized protein Dvir_GJ19296, partial [Drosophila virilis]